MKIKIGLNKIVTFTIVIQSLLLSYFLLFNNYFQQDEWHGFGIILALGKGYVTLGKSIGELLLGDRAGARIVTFWLFNTFKLNPLPYGLFALIFQLANTYLVFIITNKLIKQKNIALLAALFFLINQVGSEAYTWFGTMTGSLPSVTFFLLSLIMFINFTKNKKMKSSFFSALLLWISFLFKEVGAFAFIFYPLVYFIYSEKKDIRIFLKEYFPFILLGIVMLVFFAKTVLFIPGERANYVNTGGSFIHDLLTHSIQYPTEGLVQLTIPNDYLFWFSNIITTVTKPNLSSIEAMIEGENSTAEFLIITLLTVSVSLIFVFRKNIKKMPKDNKKIILFSILLASFSFLPYVVINRSSAYMESRYYYMGTIGISILLSAIFYSLVLNKNKFIKLFSIFMICIFIIAHEWSLFSNIFIIAQRSKERQSFMNQINSLVPSLPKNAVFFIKGDSIGYYGLPKLKTPFQSGLGQVLMVNYAIKNQLSPQVLYADKSYNLLDTAFLYDILDQNYIKIKNQGFGYYYDNLTIKEALHKNLFTVNDIIPLYYENAEQKLIRLKLDDILKR